MSDKTVCGLEFDYGLTGAYCECEVDQFSWIWLYSYEGDASCKVFTSSEDCKTHIKTSTEHHLTDEGAVGEALELIDKWKEAIRQMTI